MVWEGEVVLPQITQTNLHTYIIYVLSLYAHWMLRKVFCAQNRKFIDLEESLLPTALHLLDVGLPLARSAQGHHTFIDNTL